MSKIRPLLILPLVLLLYFLLPDNTFATSGCCSYHGGVNCAAGPQYNGRVICNDGWTGSSCYYSEMAMCGGSSYSYPTTPSCPSFSSYNSLTGSCECYSGYVAQGGSCVYGNSYCWNKYGYNSRYNSLNGSCECSYGYVFNSAGSKCISDDEACQEQYGYGSKATISGDKCECKYGYVWEGNQCVYDTPDYNYNYDYGGVYPTSTLVPTAVPSTPKPTLAPTFTPTPVAQSNSNPEPEVMGEETEAPVADSPTSTPGVTTTGDSTAGSWFFLAVLGFIGWIFYRYRYVIRDRFRRN